MRLSILFCLFVFTAKASAQQPKMGLPLVPPSPHTPGKPLAGSTGERTQLPLPNEAKFWGYKPEFTPAIEEAIKSQLLLRDQQAKSGRFGPQWFSFDREDLRKLSQPKKEEALIYFITVNQPRYEQWLRWEIRALLSRIKADATSKAALKEIQKIQQGWGG